MQFTFKHTNFNVLDLQRSLDFYKEALGLTEQSRIDGEMNLPLSISVTVSARSNWS